MNRARPDDFPTPDQLDTPVVLYSTRFCGFCRAAEALLARHEIPFSRVNVTRDKQARQWLRHATGQRTVPQIFIGGQSIGGFRELSQLAQSGQLQQRISRVHP